MLSLFKKNKKEIYIDPDKLPSHVAIIPDGNRRWAKKRGLASAFGHREGARRIREIIGYARDAGIKHISFFIFSTENWSRAEKEVAELMDLILEFLIEADRELDGSNARMNIVGETWTLSDKIKNEISRIENKTKDRNGINLNLFLNYGSRQEILNAVRNICKDAEAGRIDISSINSDMFRSYFYSPGIPDPDLVIRTSGEYRISNFLLWQDAYSELYFSDKLWPDFTVDEFKNSLADYQSRNRRFGGY
jgi:undecaprenyl diphosphate synthase